MCRTVRTHRFKKDVALARRRGKDLGKLRRILERLIAEEPLSDLHRTTPSSGTMWAAASVTWSRTGCSSTSSKGRDIIFERTGPHADLFR
jgi:mRNA interferase YafQ